MRTYIFTDMEREIIRDFLQGKQVPIMAIAKIKHRVKRFKELEDDVALYLKLREKFKQSSSSPKRRS